MRAVAVAALLGMSVAPAAAFAQTTASSATAAAPSAAAPAHYTTADTDIGTLLDDPPAKAILDKHMPGFSTKDQIDMARSMTLKTVQQYAPDTMSDKVLADIDADFAALPVKK